MNPLGTETPPAIPKPPPHEEAGVVTVDWDHSTEDGPGGYKLRYRSRLEHPRQAVFDWHMRRGAFDRMVPPWERVEVLEAPDRLEAGGRVILRIPIGPLRRRWSLRIDELEPGHRFADFQRKGPFVRWRHHHRFFDQGRDASVLDDEVEYALPFGALGRWLAGRSVGDKLERMFRFRHRRLAWDLYAHALQASQVPMKVLISGSTGLVGSELVAFLRSGGHEVVRMVRGEGQPGEPAVHWSPNKGKIDRHSLEGVDAVVHLSGENIGAGRWTAEKKRKIRESRIQSTQLLCEALAGLERPPRVLVSASAIGYYGDRGAEPLTEESAQGTGFLADLCRDWEQATAPAQEKGVRVVHLRTGLVLTPQGGLLPMLLTPFKLGLGGRIGSGEQFMSWIALDDLVGAIHHALGREDLSGPMNAVAPAPVDNAEFTRVLGRVLKRPTLFPMPAFAARLLFGSEKAEETALVSQNVQPVKLEQTGYAFRHPELEDALRSMLGR